MRETTEARVLARLAAVDGLHVTHDESTGRIDVRKGVRGYYWRMMFDDGGRFLYAYRLDVPAEYTTTVRVLREVMRTLGA